jgi:PAS domain S-box-containing protein
LKLLTNPVFFRMSMALVSAVAAFVVGVIAMRAMRKKILDDGNIGEDSSAAKALPMQTYAVIQQLKQQKFELQSEQQQERRRTKASEQITASIIANLPCGMLFVAPNGLVRQANGAARQLLGFASPVGMSIGDLLREAKISSEPGSKVSTVFEAALRGKPQRNHFGARYVAPNGTERTLTFSLIPIENASKEVLGVAVAITDDSPMTELRDAQLVHAELSTEMALELRASLAAIREWTQRMNATKDRTATQDLAEDVNAETERLNRVVGGFLRGNEKARAAQA